MDDKKNKATAPIVTDPKDLTPDKGKEGTGEGGLRMKEKTVEKAISATRRNYNFGTAVIFEGRCIQVWPAEDGSFTLASGCYTEPDDLPEFEAMRRAGAEYKKIDMGAGLVKITATMTPEQFKAYLAAADEADWEA